MCLITVENEKEFITNKPLLVFKDGLARARRYYSSFRGYEYDKGVLSRLVKWKLGDTIDEGYHAWLKLSDCNFYGYDRSFVFIIPKGTRCIKGTFITGVDCIVAEQIVYIGSVWSPFSWFKALTHK